MRAYILRHGKADRDSPTGYDLDRPLLERGRAQARFIAEGFLAGAPPLELRPALVLASRASRAAMTASTIAKALNLEVAYEDDLFPEQSVWQALRLVASCGPSEPGSPVLLVGHNPQLEGLIRTLAGPVLERLRTGEVVSLEVAERAGKLSGSLLGASRLPAP